MNLVKSESATSDTLTDDEMNGYDTSDLGQPGWKPLQLPGLAENVEKL